MRTPKCLAAAALIVVFSPALVVRPATAQDAPAPPPPAAPVLAPVLAPSMDPNAAPDASPILAPAPTTATTMGALSGPDDHHQVIRHWGVEARRIATFQRSALRNDRACAGKCEAELNALSLRRWVSPNYAWSLGLALTGGGGRTRSAMESFTWDTHLGLGPTLGASFLLTSWKHLAVSFGPQLDAVYFLQSGSGAKTWLFNLRGLIEGELHLGFIGLPQLSVALSSGLAASYATTSKSQLTPAGTAREWSIGFTGPQSLWGLVTNMAVRFYF